MSEAKRKADWPIIAALAVAVLFLTSGGAYIVGYFATSKVTKDPDLRTCRAFNAKWQYNVYGPMVEVERKIRGGKFYPAWRSTMPPNENEPEYRPHDLP